MFTKILYPTKTKLVFPHKLQKYLLTLNYFVYFNPTRKLYIDMDLSKEFGISIIIYYIKEGIILKTGE
jgi:hypothetical protein